MSDSREVSVDDLVKISHKLVESFFPTNDIYSLLVLSLVTVTTYSHKKRHINTQIRIDLAIEFIPDLIQMLVDDHIITTIISENLTKEYVNKRGELPSILQAYIYAA